MTHAEDTRAQPDAAPHGTPHDTGGRPTAEAIRAWLVARCADALEVPVESLDPSGALTDYGLGSVQAVSLVGDLEEWLGRQLPATLFWDYPTLDAVASELARLRQRGSDLA
jgi:acyl carrier protein